jgi:PII-like signaling protein
MICFNFPVNGHTENRFENLVEKMTTPGTKGGSEFRGIRGKTGATKTGRQTVGRIAVNIGPAVETVAGKYQGLNCTKKPLDC